MREDEFDLTLAKSILFTQVDMAQKERFKKWEWIIGWPGRGVFGKTVESETLYLVVPIDQEKSTINSASSYPKKSGTK